MEHDPRYGPTLSYYSHQNWPPERQGYQSESTSPVDEYESAGPSPYGYIYPAAAGAQLRSPSSAGPYPHLPAPWPSAIPSHGNAFPSYNSGRAIYPPSSQYMPLQAAPLQPTQSPPIPPPATPTPRRTLTDADRRRMCQYAEENPSKKQTEIGEAFGVERSTVSKVLRQKEKYLLPESQRSPRKRGKEISLQHTLAVWVQRQEQERGELPSDAAILQQARTLAAALPALADSQLAFHEPDWLNKFKAEWKDHWAENPDGSYASLGRHESSSSSVPVSRDVRDLGHSKEVKRPDTPRAYQVMKAPDQAASRSNPGQTFAFEYKKPGRSPPQLHSPVIENNGRPHSPSPWPYSSYSPATQCPSDQLPPYAQTYPPPAGSGSATWPPPYPYNQPQWQGSSQYPSYPRPPPPPLKSPPAITETTTQLAKRELEPSTPSGDLPTYDQAQEALQTLQRYIRHFQSSLQQNEKELIQRLDAVKLKPSLPDLPKHSTGTELGASKRKIKRAKSQHLK